jgi:hypothetical protein
MIETPLPQASRAALALRAKAIVRQGLRCAVEVRTGADHACAEGWEPRVLVLDPEAPTDVVIDEVERTLQFEPGLEVRLAAYTPRLRRAESPA